MRTKVSLKFQNTDFSICKLSEGIQQVKFFDLLELTESSLIRVPEEPAGQA